MTAQTNSVQAGPVVGNEDGIAGIRGIVLHARRLARSDSAQVSARFEAGNILCGFVRDA